ncbi:hypothetical protein [Spirosoma sp. KNUC1025]|uniref:hypothetical protein n=1 Tax=Spirosoma sp. KNUC1025 TaxID=2894082 RepID=UPI0038686ECC|nr:hypothetical protein LN737_12525 [Spirosoma sp. KNUC1025]
MEFDELQKIWDSQTHEPLWAINEQALQKRVLAKKAQVDHITNFSELITIVVNAGAGSFVFGLNFFKSPANPWLYLMAVWMVITALYVLVGRLRRLKGISTFHRTLLDELNHAVVTATYQVRLSQLMRWNIVPIGVLVLLGIWQGEKSIWLAVGILVFLTLTYFAGGWEHRIYVAKKRELEALQQKLEQA